LFFFSSRRRHTRFSRDWSSDVCSSDLVPDHVDLWVVWKPQTLIYQDGAPASLLGGKAGQHRAGHAPAGPDEGPCGNDLLAGVQFDVLVAGAGDPGHELHFDPALDQLRPTGVSEFAREMGQDAIPAVNKEH